MDALQAERCFSAESSLATGSCVQGSLAPLTPPQAPPAPPLSTKPGPLLLLLQQDSTLRRWTSLLMGGQDPVLRMEPEKGPDS